MPPILYRQASAQMSRQQFPVHRPVTNFQQASSAAMHNIKSNILYAAGLVLHSFKSILNPESRNLKSLNIHVHIQICIWHQCDQIS